MSKVKIVAERDLSTNGETSQMSWDDGSQIDMVYNASSNILDLSVYNRFKNEKIVEKTIDISDGCGYIEFNKTLEKYIDIFNEANS